MPTAGGKPQAGERVMFQQTLPGVEPHSPRYGTVVKRGTGDYWTLYVRWDDERPGDRMKQAHGQPGVTMMIDAAYNLAKGWLRVIA